MPKHRKRHHRSHSSDSDDSDKEKRRNKRLKMQLIEMERRLNAIEQASKHRPPLPEPAELDVDDRQFSEERSVAASSLDSAGDILQLHAGDDQADQLEEGEQENELSDDILNILGEDTSKEKKHGPDFQKDVASRWTRVLKTGLNEDDRKLILEKYVPPENCSLLKAPVLNPEVKAAINESVLRRDCRLAHLQEQIGASLVCIGSVLTMVLKDGGTDKKYVELLNDAGRLLTDLQHTETMARRDLITLNLNKEMKETLTNVVVDGFLFGENLEDRLKATKNLERSSQELKALKPKPPVKTITQRSLNYRSLPRPQQGARRGGQYKYHQAPSHNQPRREQYRRSRGPHSAGPHSAGPQYGRNQRSNSNRRQ